MQALCKSCRLLFVLRWNLFFVSSSPHFIRAFGGAVGIPFDWWDSFTLNFFFLLPDFIRFASGYHDPREANGCFFSLVANPETQLFCRCLYHEILCSLCQQVLIRCCSPFESISNGFVPTYVSAQRSVFCSLLPFLSNPTTFSFCFCLTFFD